MKVSLLFELMIDNPVAIRCPDTKEDQQNGPFFRPWPRSESVHDVSPGHHGIVRPLCRREPSRDAQQWPLHQLCAI